MQPSNGPDPKNHLTGPQDYQVQKMVIVLGIKFDSTHQELTHIQMKFLMLGILLGQ
jgi:hypothetical protein